MTTTITPYLIVRRGSEALEFYRRAFGAEVTLEFVMDDGRVGHSELVIAGAPFKLADEFPEMDIVGPETLGGTTVTIDLDVPDVDAVVAAAVAAGASMLRPVEDQFHGSRVGQMLDPFGHRWSISTLLEELTVEEIQRRAAELD